MHRDVRSVDVAARTPATAAGAPAEGPALRVRCWGTRGSIASPGPATALIGGNTPCVEVRTRGGHRLILDAGTGIRELGRRLVEENGTGEADLFLTHFHWDHIQGVPFFLPLYNPAYAFTIHGARQGNTDIQTLFAGQMGPIYFPIPFEALAATLRFVHLDEPWSADGVDVSAFRVRHPADTYGYRIRAGGATVAYIPDNELVGSSYPVDHPTWRERLVEFIAGADLLFHDAMFTEEEYARREGWGHSTFEQAVALAEEAEVKCLMLFHHAPERSDQQLLGILDDLRNDLERRASPLEVDLAREGLELPVQEDES